MSAVDPEMIKQTQDTLGKFVKKPPLTDKLLSKPPFRFLHDVFTVVIKDGTMEGLFDDAEMNHENVKDKEAKVKYLEKIIDCISFSTGQTLSVRPGKIVSGQEAAKTNELLQAIALVIENKIDTSEAVKKVRNGEKPGKEKKRSKKDDPEKKSKSKDKSPDKRDRENKENRSSNKESSKKREDSLDKNSAKNRRGRSPSPPNITNATNGQEVPSDPAPNTIQHNALDNDQPESLVNGNVIPILGPAGARESSAKSTKEDDKTAPSSATSRPASSRPHTVKDKKKKSKPVENVQEKEPEEVGVLGSNNQQEQEVARPATAARGGSARPRTGRMRSARPPSARPAAPRVKVTKEVVLEEQPRPATSKVANVILDNEEEEDDGEDFLIEEAPKDPLLSLESDPTIEAMAAAAVEDGGQEHGALVQQILATQEELEDGNKVQQDVVKKGVEIEREAGVGEAGRIRDRASTQREVDKLRSSIQTLTRSANPLGKLMDFLQEDVDSMQRELDQWREENRKLQLELKHEESLTDQSIQPLKVHLTELDTAVQEQLDKISMVKSNILRNEEKIEKMIASIGVTNK